MAFLSEDEPEHDTLHPVAPGLGRIVAPNRGVMTYHGTNTYLLAGDETVVVDPGPQDAGHLAAILRATGGRVDRILVTHGHGDHVGLASSLRSETSAPVCGFVPSLDPGLTIDVPLVDGDRVGALDVLHTPGHAPDHLCFASDTALFSGDHAMTWSSTVVRPPLGDMSAYMFHLDRVARRAASLLLPGHGPPLPAPATYLRRLLDGRRRRESLIAASLGPDPVSSWDLVARLYAKADPALRRAAEGTVSAHLIKLEAEGSAIRVGDLWRASR